MPFTADQKELNKICVLPPSCTSIKIFVNLFLVGDVAFQSMHLDEANTVAPTPRL